MGRLSSIENQSFLQPHHLISLGSHNLLVDSGGLPIPRGRRSVWSVPIWVLSLSGTEEIPFLLRIPWNTNKSIPHSSQQNPNSQLPKTPQKTQARKWKFYKNWGNQDVKLTRQIPWISLANVDLRDDRSRQRAGKNLPLQVLNHKLFIRRVEPEPRGQSEDAIFDEIELLHRRPRRRRRNPERKRGSFCNSCKWGGQFL